jgi:hypothetical protein
MMANATPPSTSHAGPETLEGADPVPAPARIPPNAPEAPSVNAAAIPPQWALVAGNLALGAIGVALAFSGHDGGELQSVIAAISGLGLISAGLHGYAVRMSTAPTKAS